MNTLKEWAAQTKTALLLLVFMSILTGILYPAVIHVAAQFIFPWQANGSLVYLNHKPIGSLLLGQSFSEKKYFWGRPSTTEDFPYNPLSSAGSNLALSNPKYLLSVQERAALLRSNHPNTFDPIPADLVTASGSGLDPDISPAAAYYQIKRIAEARNIAEEDLGQLIRTHLKPRFLGILGEPRTNVLELNLALDNLNFQTDGSSLDTEP